MAGVMASRKLVMRVGFLEQYLKFISFLATEIRYSASSIFQILEKYSKVEFLAPLLKGCTVKIEKRVSLSDAFQDAVDELPKEYGLTQEDLQLLKEFGQGLGTSDIEGQLAHCALHTELMNTYLENAREEKKKKAKLYVMLGLLSGIAAALLFS